MSKTMNPVERAEAELKALEDERNALATPDPGDPASQTPAEPVATDPPSSEPPAAPPEEDYKQKYYALQGMFNGQKKQLEALSQQNQQLVAQMEELIKRVDSRPAASTPGATPDDHHQHLQGLITEYGEPMLNAIKTVAEAALGSRLAELEGKLSGMADLANKITQFEKDKAQSDSEAFMARLTARLPNWQQLMQSAEYLVWRDTATEPFTAKTYGELFDQANSQWNLEGMVGVFKAFINAHPNWTPPQLTTIDNPGVTPPPQPPSPPADPRAAMVTPGQRSATPSAPAGNEPRTFKQSEVEAIFTNMRRGLYTQEEMMRLDREIMEANVQGRIVAG